MLAGASPAAAGDAVLWACHGPGGEGFGLGPLARGAGGDGRTEEFAGGCAGAGGVRATFSRATPAVGSHASWTLDAPPGTTLRSVRVGRETLGFGGAPNPGNPQRYAAETADGPLESARLDDATNARLTGVLERSTASGGHVRVGVACELGPVERCPPPWRGTVGVEISFVALGVTDASPPRGAVGGLRSPAAGVLDLSITAADDGLGLASASATLDGERVAATPLGGPTCADLTPADATIDLRGGAQCPAVVAGAGLRVDTTGMPDGPHRLRVEIADAAGNVSAIADEEILVLNHPPETSATATLRIGSDGLDEPGPPAAPPPSARPGLRPAPGPACRVPRLSMLLASKPLRLSRGRPVLAAGRRYRYRGRLTCRIGGRRRSAPRGTVVDVLNVIRGRRRTRRPTRVGARGRIALTLAYPTSRTIIFRHRSVDGTAAQVRINVRVVRVRGGKERRSR